MSRPLITVTTDWVLNFGTYIFKGPFSQTMFTIAWDTPEPVSETGAAGVGSVIVQPNLAATMTINVHQGSADSSELERQYLLWLKSGLALPFGAKNTRDGSIYVAEAAWITKLPDKSAGTALVEQAWVLRTQELVPETQDGATV